MPLGAKLRVPALRRTVLDRARLANPLRPDGPLPRLVLIAATPGFGKTTLLTQWLNDLRVSDGGPAVALHFRDAHSRWANTRRTRSTPRYRDQNSMRGFDSFAGYRLPVSTYEEGCLLTSRFSRSDMRRPSTASPASSSGKIHMPVHVETAPKAGGARVEPV